VEVCPTGPKIGISPFSIHYEGGSVARCGIDIGCLQKNELSRGKGESHPWWEGKPGIFFFKVHANPTLLDPEKRIFPMPQSIGRNVFVDSIPRLRTLRACQPNRLDVFGIMTAGGLRAEACFQVRAGGWHSLVGIMKDRKGSLRSTPRAVMVPPMDATTYFLTMAISRLALSLPSHGTNDGPWCSYRHVEAWALGVPVLTIRPKEYHVFGDPKGCWYEMNDVLSNLKDTIDEALADREGLQSAGQRAARYFDENFSPERHAAYVLETIERNGGPR
jgi:hypothetical protein